MKRLLLAGSGLLVVAFSPGVSAAQGENVPASASVRVTTSITGVGVLPVSGVNGEWVVQGRSAHLHMQGASATGSTTRIHSEWKSSWRETPGSNRPALRLKVRTNHRSVLPGIADNNCGWHVAYRLPGQGWTRDPFDVEWVQQYEPAYIVEVSLTGTRSTRAAALMQWRVRLDCTWEDTSITQLDEWIRQY